MKALLRFVEREDLWPLFVLVLGVVLLLPGLGRHGFWEPHEIGIADRAAERAGAGDDAAGGDVDGDDAAGDDADSDQASSTTRAEAGDEDVSPPLTEWLAGQGMKRAGTSELGARLPLALMGVLALMATFYLGRRLASPRAGLIAALVLASFPLFVFQSRQLMSDIGAVTGSALVLLGFAGLAWPTRTPRAWWRYAADVALIAAGAVMSYYAAAALLGLVVPFAAVALACLGSLWAHAYVPRSAHPTTPDAGARSPSSGLLKAGLAVLVAELALAVALALTSDAPHEHLGLVLGPVIMGVVLVAAGVVPWRRPPRHRPARVLRHRRHLLAVALAASALTLATLYVVLSQIFELRDPVPGERALFGRSLIPDEEPSAAVGGVWSLRDDLDATFDVLFEQIAFGLFPWVALAPIAVARVGMGTRDGKRILSGFLLFGWATLAWVVATILTRKVDMVLYPGLVPVAAAIGVWLDDLMGAREQADATTESETDARSRFGMPLRLPLAALFTLLAALIIGKDVSTFPDRFLSVNLPDTTIEYPGDTTLLKVELKVWVAVFAALFGLALAAGLLFWTRHRRNRDAVPRLYYLRRYGVHGALGIGLVFALFLTQCWTPAMSRKFSSRHIFSVYHELRSDGDELGVQGNPGSGPRYYAGGDFEKLANRASLLDFLRRDNRTFALAPASQLCGIHRAAKGELDYYVLDDTNAKFLLLSNQLRDGERDRNPLSRAIVRDLPDNIPIPMSVNYDGRVELIGVAMPASVGRSESFEMTMFFKVLKRVGGNWKIFAHFDPVRGSLRFQGDHEPINGRCGTSYWQPGDYIVDTFTVTAGNFTYPKGAYDVHVGFFRGSHGNYKNMEVDSARDADGADLPVGKDDRVLIGRIQVE